MTSHVIVTDHGVHFQEPSIYFTEAIPFPDGEGHDVIGVDQLGGVGREEALGPEDAGVRPVLRVVVDEAQVRDHLGALQATSRYYWQVKYRQ